MLRQVVVAVHKLQSSFSSVPLPLTEDQVDGRGRGEGTL